MDDPHVLHIDSCKWQFCYSFTRLALHARIHKDHATCEGHTFQMNWPFKDSKMSLQNNYSSPEHELTRGPVRRHIQICLIISIKQPYVMWRIRWNHSSFGTCRITIFPPLTYKAITFPVPLYVMLSFMCRHSFLYSKGPNVRRYWLWSKRVHSLLHFYES